jgi:hypothetical protein
MTPTKLILLLLVAYIVVRLVRSFFKQLIASSLGIETGGKGRQRPTVRSASSSQMARCEECGMFITRGSAVISEGREFCSTDCLKGKVRRA